MALTRTAAGRFRDDFDGSALGGSWSNISVGTPTVSGGNLLIPTGGAEVVLLTDALGSSVQDVTVKLGIGGNAVSNAYPLARAAANNSYYVAWFGVTPITHYKRTAGSWSQVGGNGAGGTGPYAAGDVLSLKATGAATTALVSAKNGTTQLSNSDSSSPHTSGKVGLRALNSGASMQQIAYFEAYKETTTLTVTGLPSGWKVSCNAGTTKFTESGGTATVTGLTAGTSYTLTVYNAADVQQDSQAGVYPGDGWAYAGLVISEHPQSKTAFDDQPIGLTAAASDPAASVQWQRSTTAGGSTFADISGATSTTLGIAATLADDGCNYRAVFTNEAGTATTNAATLTVVAVDTSPSHISVIRYSGKAVIDFATDPDVAYFASHDVYRNGALIANLPTPVCHAEIEGDTAGDVYTVWAKDGSGAHVGTPRTGAATAAAPVLTLGTYTSTEVPLEWTDTGAVSYEVRMRPHRSNVPSRAVRINQARTVASVGTADSHTDTAPRDGSWWYAILATYADGSTAYSNEVLAHIAKSPYMTPYERVLEARSIRTPAGDEYTVGSDNPRNSMEHPTLWLDEEVLFSSRHSEVLATRWGPGYLAYLDDKLASDGTPQIDVETFSPFGWIQQDYLAVAGYPTIADTSWNAATGVGGLMTQVAKWTWDFQSTGSIEGRFAYFTSHRICNLVLGYKVGGTTYYVTNWTTRKVMFDQVAGQAVIDLEVTANGVTTHYTLTIRHGRIRIAGSVSDPAASLVWKDNGAASPSGTFFSSNQGARQYRGHGDRGANKFTTFTLTNRLAAAWTVSHSSAESVYTVTPGDTATHELADVWQGAAGIQSRIASYAVPDTDVLLGGPMLHGRVLLMYGAYLKNHIDAAAKAKADALASTVYSLYSTMAFVTAEMGCLLYYYAAMHTAYGDATYGTRKTALVNSLKAASPDSDPQNNGFARFGLLEAGETTEAQRWQNAVTDLGNDPVYDYTAKWVHVAAAVNPLASNMLTMTSYVLRRAVWTSPGQMLFNYKGSATGHHNTPLPEAMGEAHTQVTDICNRLRGYLGDMTPIYLGNGAPYDDMGSRQNGTISALAFNPSTRELSFTVDKDIQIFMGARGEPLAVMKAGVALTEHTGAFDPTYGGSSFSTQLGGNDRFHYDPATNVLTITANASASYTVEVADVSFALSASEVDAQGGLLSWSEYPATIRYHVYRGTTAGVDASDTLLGTVAAGVATFHDTTASESTTYFYRVLAETTGDDAWSNEIEVATAGPISGGFGTVRTVAEAISGGFAVERTVTTAAPTEPIEGGFSTVRTVGEFIAGSFSVYRTVVSAGLPTLSPPSSLTARLSAAPRGARDGASIIAPGRWTATPEPHWPD